MFTPPQSPGPYQTTMNTTISPSSSEKVEVVTDRLHDIQAAKRRTGKRFRLAVISVPLIVIILTLCASYRTSRAAQGAFHPPSPLTWHAWVEDPLRRLHKRNPLPEPQSPSPSTGTSRSTTPSQTPVANQPIPNVPSSAPAALPTPFPQPFDGSIAQNFSTVSCSKFFANMTSETAFRSCRPISLLQGTSSDFINVGLSCFILETLY